MKNHSDCVNAVRLHISKMGGVCLKYTTGTFRTMDDDARVITVGQEGASDTIACVQGLFFGIEIKFSDSDRQKKKQKNFEEAVTAAGGTYILADFRHGRDGLKAVTEGIRARCIHAD